MSGPARFWRWAGGKGNLLVELDLALFPDVTPTTPVGRFVDLTVGGGAAVLHAVGARRARRYLLADLNARLVGAIRTLLELRAGALALSMLERWAAWPVDEQREHYRACRDYLLDDPDPAVRAAAFAFVLACGYNGLYRENRAGKYNAPFTRGASRTLVARLAEALDLLRAVEPALEWRIGDVATVAVELGPDDVAYFDPPYLGTFDAYQAKRFTVADHRRAAAALRAAVRRGARVVVSGSDCELTRQIYPGEVRVVRTERSVGCDPETRGPVDELLVILAA